MANLGIFYSCGVQECFIYIKDPPRPPGMGRYLFGLNNWQSISNFICYYQVAQPVHSSMIRPTKKNREVEEKESFTQRFNRFKMIHRNTYFIVPILLINFLISLYLLNIHNMVTFDGTFYIRYYNGDNSWLGPFPFGYPLIIGFFKFFISDEVFAASLAVAFFGSALLVPLSQILIHLFSKRIGLLLLLVAAFNPVVLYYSSVTYSEIPYLFFLIFSLWMYFKNKQFLAVLFASISYLIRPEGLIFAVAYAIIFFIKDRQWKNLLITTSIIISILLLFMVGNHSRKGEWAVTSKFSNINLLKIDDWKMNEELRSSDDSMTGSELTLNLVDQYPKRLLALLNYIAISSTWPLVIIGLIGLLLRLNIFWLFILQLLLTPMSGTNMALRLGLPYFYVLLIVSGFLIKRISPKQGIKFTIIFISLIGILFIPNLKYLLQPALNDNDFNFVETKGVGLFIKGTIPEDAVIMDRKPYVTFYSGAGKYIEIPTGSINEVFLSIQKNNVDFLVLSERIISTFRPNLIPLLTEQEQNVNPFLTTVYNDLDENKGFGTRIYKVIK